MVKSMPAAAAMELEAAPNTPIAIGLFAVISALVILCTFYPGHNAGKRIGSHDLEAQPTYTKLEQQYPAGSPKPTSRLTSPRRFLKSLSEKAMNVLHLTKPKNDEAGGGFWRQKILMGQRCEPPKFSGIIQYDDNGNSLPSASPEPVVEASQNTDSSNVSNNQPDLKSALRSPPEKPRRLLSILSLKLPSIFYGDRVEEDNKGAQAKDEAEPEAGAVWQRPVIMGKKCDPPTFSGVLFYDSNGNPVPELPPRRPQHKSDGSASFSFPANCASIEVESEPETPRLRSNSTLIC